MKKLKRVLGVGILVAVVGLLVFGAINRTMAKSELTEEDYQEVPSNELVNGNGNGNGESSEQEIEIGVNTTVPEVDHDTLTTPVALLPVGAVDQNEIDALLYMREEEKLARDVYTYLAQQWGLPVFSNIASSEQTHMDSVLELINRYGLTDPASDQIGVFNNAELQSLYTQLIVQGSLSVEEAFKVGAAIEEIDILDLQQRLVQTDQVDIQQVFESLLSGSFNHLNAFVGNLANRTGVIYVPQYLSADVYQSILSADTNAGGFGIRGGGKGLGNP